MAISGTARRKYPDRPPAATRSSLNTVYPGKCRINYACMQNIWIAFGLLLCLGCTPTAPARPASETAEQTVRDILVFGSRGGFGSETHYRWAGGQLYASRYNGIRTNDPQNEFDHDSIATRESNWVPLNDPRLSARAEELLGDFPEAVFTDLPSQSCDALAYDGSCPYLGIYRGGTGTYTAWHGNYAEQPDAAAFMQRVESLTTALQ